ncbi:MAG: flagellar basal body P-ring formation protein FlgA [Magnetococcales bacterium]|nr:flagellar basal body P-ring formation protein FlgA [Magnetococcales bacterium]
MTMAVEERVSVKGWVSGLLMGLLTFSASFSAQAQVLQRSDVIRESEQRIKALLDQENGGVRLERVFYRDELTLPDGKVTWKVVPSAEEWRTGRQNVPVEVSVNGKVATVIQVAVTLKQSMRYLVLRRPLKRGDVVTDADLKWEESELERPPVGLVEDPKRVVGQSVTRQIQANRPLQSDWFSAPVVVTRGERVQVAASRGGLHIETTAVAHTAGRVGETIVLENPSSRRRFDARVTGPGRAEVVAW